MALDHAAVPYIFKCLVVSVVSWAEETNTEDMTDNSNSLSKEDISPLIIGRPTKAPKYDNTTSVDPEIFFSLPDHKFHFLHLLVPLIVALFLFLYICGLVFHYRHKVVMKEVNVQRLAERTSSESSAASEDDYKDDGSTELKGKVPSQTTMFKVKKFITTMDAIQT